MRMRIGWMASVLVLAMAVIAGCSGAATSPTPAVKDTPTPAAPAPATKERLKAVMAPGPKGGVLYLPEMVAEGIGAFDAEGVDLQVLDTDGGNAAAKALMSGEANFAMLAFDHVLKNRVQGADLVVVGFLTKNPGLIMIVQNDLKDTVKSIKDLKGKKIGVSSIGGGTHMTVLSLMKQAGMQPSEIEIVAAKNELGKMWENKEIAAAMHVDPQITELVAPGKAWILYDYRKSEDTKALYGTEYPLGTLVTRQEVIDKNPELVQRVVNAVMAANTYIKSHSGDEVAAKVPAGYKGENPALYEEMVKQNVVGLSLTGTVSQDSIDTVLRELREREVIPAGSTLDLSQAINLSFVTKAAK